MGIVDTLIDVSIYYAILAVSFGLAMYIRIFPEITREVSVAVGEDFKGLPKAVHCVVGGTTFTILSIIHMPFLVRMFLNKEKYDEYIYNVSKAIIDSENELRNSKDD
jgi:hypothetical protein